MSEQAPPLQRALEQAGSQAKLAAILGVSQPAINKALNASRVSAALAAGLHRHFGFPLHEIRPDLFDPPKADPTPEPAPCSA